jgi:hypothetical protein
MEDQLKTPKKEKQEEKNLLDLSILNGALEDIKIEIMVLKRVIKEKEQQEQYQKDLIQFAEELQKFTKVIAQMKNTMEHQFYSDPIRATYEQAQNEIEEWIKKK